MAWRILLYFIIINNIFAREEEKTRTVILDEGGVIGTKYWDGDFYEFFGIPYAELPTGRDRYQAPLPVKPWQSMLSADAKNIVCHQAYFTEEDDGSEEFIVSGEDDCLNVNLYVPEIASEDNLVPVVVYIHSGAYSGGNGNMARFHYLARHDIIVISFNYRLGAIGFACLGNKEIPGNAGLKDQVAALMWIKKNVKKFGGDPNKITLAGYSVGASMAELLALSKTTDGLIDQLILDSATALSPFAINRDPLGTAKNLALAMGYNGTESLEELTEFYLNASIELLAAKSLNFFLPNSTFGFAPCIENVHKGIVPFLTESPMDILRKGEFKKVPVLIGFANMEGISRTIKFGEWREKMTEDFSNFLPADLIFDSDKEKQSVSAKIKKRYFKGDQVNHEKLQNYIDYFSDSMFKYSIVKSLRMRAAVSKRKIYFYEFNYLGKLNMQHNYMDRIKGASHRDQTAYILDFFGFTNNYKDLDMRDRMTIMWADFVKYSNPTAYESAVVNYKWLSYTNEKQNYLQINKKPTMKKNLFANGFSFWNKLYEKYYWNPTPPEQPKAQNVKKYPEAKQADNVDKSKDNKLGNDGMKNKDHENKNVKSSKVVNDNISNKEKDLEKETKNEDARVEQKTPKNQESVKEIKKDSQETIKNNNVVNENKEEIKTVNYIKKENNNIKQKNVKDKKVVEEIKKENNKEQQIAQEDQKENNPYKQETAKNKKSIKETKEKDEKTTMKSETQ